MIESESSDVISMIIFSPRFTGGFDHWGGLESLVQSIQLFYRQGNRGQGKPDNWL